VQDIENNIRVQRRTTEETDIETSGTRGVEAGAASSNTMGTATGTTSSPNIGTRK